MSTISGEFLDKLRRADKRTVARAITYVESNEETAEELLKLLHADLGKSYKIGITGPPGAGKSTITNQITKALVELGKKVAIIAVDPTSPFTGGALLGDRVRMSDIGNIENVFIRSMATRGSLGGLSKKTIDAADVLDAAGYDFILFETVGVGQSELDIAQTADTTIVVIVPESGDSIQAMKAGLMEIADFFVVNKSDRPGADQAVSALQTILMMRPHDASSWMPKIIKTVAAENKGITDVLEEVERHKKYLVDNDLFLAKRQNQLKVRVKEITEYKLLELFWNEKRVLAIEDTIAQVATGEISPYKLADDLLSGVKQK
jgi:LAO/AO transport system kinase